MTEKEIIERINGFLVDEFEVDPEAILPENPLKETLDLDIPVNFSIFLLVYPCFRNSDNCSFEISHTLFIFCYILIVIN